MRMCLKTLLWDDGQGLDDFAAEIAALIKTTILHEVEVVERKQEVKSAVDPPKKRWLSPTTPDCYMRVPFQRAGLKEDSDPRLSISSSMPLSHVCPAPKRSKRRTPRVDCANTNSAPYDPGQRASRRHNCQGHHPLSDIDRGQVAATSF